MGVVWTKEVSDYFKKLLPGSMTVRIENDTSSGRRVQPSHHHISLGIRFQIAVYQLCQSNDKQVYYNLG